MSAIAMYGRVKTTDPVISIFSTSPPSASRMTQQASAVKKNSPASKFVTADEKVVRKMPVYCTRISSRKSGRTASFSTVMVGTSLDEDPFFLDDFFGAVVDAVHPAHPFQLILSF